MHLQIDNPTIEINGTYNEIDEGRGITPVVVDGRTLVPVRAIIEAFGGNVEWDNLTQTAILTINNDIIRLTVDDCTAYYNGTPYILDTAPRVINDRTMLPIRFIAEKFNLGVAWNNNTRTVTLIRNGFDEEEYNYIISQVPAYSGKPVTIINNNIPMFKPYEIISASFEFYANLENELLSALKDRMLEGVTLKAGDSFDKGFRIAVNADGAYYDYSAEAVVDMLSAYLSPKVTALLKEAR